MKVVTDISVLASLDMEEAVRLVRELQNRIEARMSEIEPLLHTGGRLFDINLAATAPGYASAAIALCLICGSLDPYVSQSVIGQQRKEKLRVIARELGIDIADVRLLPNHEGILQILG